MTARIERAEYTPDACREVLELLVVRMHPEVGLLKLDFEKSAREIDEVFREGVVFNARDENGLLVGTLGAMIGDLIWYSSEILVGDKWFYVLPEERMERIGVDLMLAVRREADKRKVPAIIGMVNPHRPQRRSFLGLVAQIAGYRIIGRLTGMG